MSSQLVNMQQTVHPLTLWYDDAIAATSQDDAADDIKIRARTLRETSTWVSLVLPPKRGSACVKKAQRSVRIAANENEEPLSCIMMLSGRFERSERSEPS